MTVEEIQKATIQKVGALMSPIVDDFEQNKDLTYSELSKKWSEYTESLTFMKFLTICEILTDNGVINPFEKNKDNILKASVVQISTPFFEDCVNEYYYTKIRPIINAKFLI